MILTQGITVRRTSKNRVRPTHVGLVLLAALVGLAGCGDSAIKNTQAPKHVDIEHVGAPDDRPDEVWVPDTWLWGEDKDAVFIPYGMHLAEGVKSVSFGEISADQVFFETLDQDEGTGRLYLPESHAAHVMRQNPDFADILSGSIDGQAVAVLVRSVDARGPGVVFEVVPFDLISVLRGDWDAKVPVDLNDPEAVAQAEGGYILRRTDDGGVVKQELGSIDLRTSHASVTISKNVFSRSTESGGSCGDDPTRSDGAEYSGGASAGVTLSGNLTVHNELAAHYDFKGRIVDENWGRADRVYFDNVGSCGDQSKVFETRLGHEVCVHRFMFYLENSGYVETTFGVEVSGNVEIRRQTDDIIDIDSLPEIPIGSTPLTIAPGIAFQSGIRAGINASMSLSISPRVDWSIPIGFEWVDNYAHDYQPNKSGFRPVPNDLNPNHELSANFDAGNLVVNGDIGFYAESYAQAIFTLGIDIAAIDVVQLQALEFGTKLGLRADYAPLAGMRDPEADCASIYPYIEPYGCFNLTLEFSGLLDALGEKKLGEFGYSLGQIKFPWYEDPGYVYWGDEGRFCPSFGALEESVVSTLFPEDVDVLSWAADAIARARGGTTPTPSGPNWVYVQNTSDQTIHVDAVELSSNQQTPAVKSYASSASGGVGSSYAVGAPDTHNGNCHSWNSHAARISPGGGLWVYFDQGVVEGDSMRVIGSQFDRDFQSFAECNLQGPTPSSSLTLSVCDRQTRSSCGDSEETSLGHKGYGTSGTVYF